jgi:hypothetical protein
MYDPRKLSISQLNELCIALGWQGGTYWQMLDEVKRLRRIVDEVQRKPGPCQYATLPPVVEGDERGRG